MVTRKKIERQDNVEAIKVPRGTPNTFAIVIPAPIIAIAPVSLPFEAILVAIIEPTPK